VATAYEVEWDATKARSNERKHKIGFDPAMTVFTDPNTMPIFDAEHSADEERWTSIGQANNGSILVVVHTLTPTRPVHARLRINSARKANKHERRQHRDG
jgi:uncharacterized DUF497 family protein